MKSQRKPWLWSFLLLSACTAGATSNSTGDAFDSDPAQGGRSSAHAPGSFDMTDEMADEILFAGSAPEAVTLELSVSPARPYYQPGQVLQLQPLARDARGERVLGIRFQYLPAPAEAVARFAGMPGRYELLEEGTISFQVCASTRLCKSLSVVVDAGSPLLVVDEPAAGAQLGADGSDVLTVRGSVSDARNSWVWVAGQPVEVDELGRFETSLPATFGINHIFVNATDGLSPQSQVRRDVLWAPAYLPVADLSVEQGLASSLPNAALLSLGQSFFDDGTRAGTSVAPRSEDLADLVALVVERAQLTSLLPDPLVNAGDALRLRVTDVRAGDVSVDVDILDGAIELFIRVARLEVDTVGRMDLSGATVSLDGGLTASLSILAQLSLNIAPDGGVKVALSEFHTLLESVTGRFVAPEANAVFRLAESSLRTTLEDALSGVLSDALVGQLPPLLEGALGSLERLLRDQHFTLSFAPLPEQTLALDGRFTQATLAYGRHVQLGLDAQVGTDTGPLYPQAPGVPQRAAVPVVETFDGRAMQLALRMDLINLLLHTLWNGGLLEIQGANAAASGQLGDLLKHVKVSGKLPPVLRAAEPWEEADAILELGQVELLFELGETSRYGLSASLPVDVNARDGALRLELGLPQIDAWLIESSAATPLAGEDLAEIALPLLLPVLEDALNGNPIALDLPSFAVGALTDLAPSLQGFELALQPGDDVVVRGDALIIDLRLIGSIP